jgi:hypothetical protein
MSLTVKSQGTSGSAYRLVIGIARGEGGWGRGLGFGRAAMALGWSLRKQGTGCEEDSLFVGMCIKLRRREIWRGTGWFWAAHCIGIAGGCKVK